MTAVKITADFSDILIQSVWRPWLRCCFHSEKALFMALCKGKTELRPEMGEEATDERFEAAGKRVYGKKKRLRRALMGMCPFCFMAPVRFFVAAGKNPVRKPAAAMLTG